MTDRNSIIGIAGCGGLGSNIAVHLVRSGVLNLKIVDFDVIESGNLNRQFYFADQVGLPKAETLAANLKRINPDVKIEFECKRLTAENIGAAFRHCGIIVEGFDKAEAKVMILEAFAGGDKFLVSASGLAGLDVSGIRVRKFGERAYIVGDMVSDIKDKKLYSPKIFIVASMMANLILQELDFKD